VKRREFIKLIGGEATAWPLAARPQQPTMPVIGFLNGSSAWEYAYVVGAFREGLKQTGYIDGENVFIEYRWAEGHYERLSTLATDLLNRRVAVIAANAPAAVAAKEATKSVPIVFVTAADPVKIGLVASLNRPGGNLTGVGLLSVELAPKKLQMLHELVPNARTMTLLVNSANPNAQTQTRGYSLPAIFQYREFAAAGGLMSYGTSLTETYRQVGVYVGRILKGEKAADLPVQQATKVELIINLRTAKALGIEVPPTLLGRADEVIE